MNVSTMVIFYNHGVHPLSANSPQHLSDLRVLH